MRMLCCSLCIISQIFVASSPMLETPALSDRQAPQRDFSLKVDVNLVTIDTTVRNRQGAIVSDLQAEDFLVYDNGLLQPLTSVSRDQLPLAVALLIDCSPSITKYLRELRNAAVIALQRLKPEDQVMLFSFAQCPYRLCDLTEDRSKIIEMIGNLRVIDRGTNVFDSVCNAAHYLRAHAPDRRHAIILISDDYSDTSRFDERETVQALLQASATLINIRTPGSGTLPPAIAAVVSATKGSPFNFSFPATVERMAAETGGEVFKLSGEGKLTGALETAFANLRLQYTLSFSPANAGDGGSLHRIEVKLSTERSCRGCKVQARRGYYTGSRVSPVSGNAGDSAMDKPYDCDGLKAQLDDLSSQRAIKAAAADRRETHDIPFKVVTAKTAEENALPRIDVHLLIDARKIGFNPVAGRYRNKLRIAVIYADTQGKTLGSDWKSAEVDLSEVEYRLVLRGGFPFSTSVPLRVSKQVLKIVVYDPISRKVGSKFIIVKPGRGAS